MELYVVGAINSTTLANAEAMIKGKGYSFIIRDLHTGLVDLVRLRDRPLYSGQHPYRVRATDIVRVGE